MRQHIETLSKGEKYSAFKITLNTLKQTFSEALALLKFPCREFLFLLLCYPLLESWQSAGFCTGCNAAPTPDHKPSVPAAGRATAGTNLFPRYQKIAPAVNKLYEAGQ